MSDSLPAAAEQGGSSGVVLLHRGNQPILELAAGIATRADARPMTLETLLATASGTKGFTALTVVSMIEDGRLGFATRLSEVVGGDLPNADPSVTIEIFADGGRSVTQSSCEGGGVDR